MKFQLILTAVSLVLFANIFAITPGPPKKKKADPATGTTRHITVSSDFKIKHIRRGNCKQDRPIRTDPQNATSIKEDLNRTAIKWDFFQYISKNPKIKTKRKRKINTFIMTDHKTADEIAGCLAIIADKRYANWTRGKYDTSRDLKVNKKDFNLCHGFSVNQMYLAVINEIDWQLFPKDIPFKCQCYSGNFTFNISLAQGKSNASYTINHYASQNADGNGEICH